MKYEFAVIFKIRKLHIKKKNLYLWLPLKKPKGLLSNSGLKLSQSFTLWH